mmetsp:Transcript_61643/g.170880  ORF Transcript_61643/g.170880 Transcript_61643/m.170880 type:complete len:236 (-) Transcript_61643:65-772(-)
MLGCRKDVRIQEQRCAHAHSAEGNKRGHAKRCNTSDQIVSPHVILAKDSHCLQAAAHCAGRAARCCRLCNRLNQCHGAWSARHLPDLLPQLLEAAQATCVDTERQQPCAISAAEAEVSPGIQPNDQLRWPRHLPSVEFAVHASTAMALDLADKVRPIKAHAVLQLQHLLHHRSHSFDDPTTTQSFGLGHPSSGSDSPARDNMCATVGAHGQHLPYCLGRRHRCGSASARVHLAGT